MSHDPKDTAGADDTDEFTFSDATEPSMAEGGGFSDAVTGEGGAPLADVERGGDELGSVYDPAAGTPVTSVYGPPHEEEK